MPPAIAEALAASCGSRAHVWHPFGGQPDLGNFAVASDGKLYAVQWNQNNKVIVSGGQSGLVALNYSRDGALMGTLPKAAPTSPADRLAAISSIAFSRGSKLLAAGCTDSSVRVWDLKQQACKYFLDSHKAAVTYVAFSPDDQQLASSCLTGEIHLHTVRQTSQAAVLRTPGNRAKRSLHFTPLEPLLATGAEDGSLYCWDTSTYTLLDSYLQMHSATVSRVCFSPGSPSILVSAGLDRAAVLTDRRLDAAVARVQAELPLTALDCHHSGQCISVGTAGGSVLLYDPRRLDAPTLELACSDGEPVTCLHWQQAPAPARASRQDSGLRSPAAAASPSLASAGTPPPPPQPPPALRAQELLSAASPATPMVPSARAGPGTARQPAPAPALQPALAVSSGSQRSLAASERLASHAAAQPQPPASAREAARAPAAAAAAPARMPAHEPAAADASLLTAGRGAAAPASARLSAREQLAAPPPAPAAERHASREEPAAAPAAAVDEATPASARQNGARPSACADAPPSARRPALDPEPGPPGDGLPGPREAAAGGGEGGRSAGPSAAAASFGVRLKSMLAAQPPDEPLPELDGHAAPSAHGGLPPSVEDVRAAISSDIKTLHYEMVRQFHLQQVETRQLVEAVVRRQDSLAQDLAGLRAQVQALAARQPGPQAPWE